MTKRYLDQAERDGLSDEQRAKVDALAVAYGRLPVFLSGRLGDEWIIVIVGHDSANVQAIHRDGRTFDTGATWAEGLSVIADPDDVAKRVERADSLEPRQD